MEITIHRKAKTQATEIQKKNKRIYLIIKGAPLFIVLLFFLICFRPYILQDSSMNKKIVIGTILDSELNYGDVILCKVDDTLQIRRIIGMPGDEIVFCYDTIYINGKECDEIYYHGPTYSNIYTTSVPYDSYFVLADNRTGYQDSREYGPVYNQEILQKIIFMF